MLDADHRPMRQCLVKATFTCYWSALDRSCSLLILVGCQVVKGKKMKMELNYPTTAAKTPPLPRTHRRTVTSPVCSRRPLSPRKEDKWAVEIPQHYTDCVISLQLRRSHGSRTVPMVIHHMQPGGKRSHHNVGDASAWKKRKKNWECTSKMDTPLIFWVSGFRECVFFFFFYSQSLKCCILTEHCT